MLDTETSTTEKLLPIVLWPDPILSTICEDVVDFDSELVQLAVDMMYTMRQSNGVGLSAPQVGITKRVLVVYKDPIKLLDPIVMVNPVISQHGDLKFKYSEGCLSVPGYFEERERYQSITVEWHNVNGFEMSSQFHQLAAFVIQHEIDHLDGHVFVDDLSPLKHNRIKKKIDKTIRHMK